ncbi:MAG: sulfite exporter TauE/SafE family protein [Thermoleophilaceae bacterium]|nr:sulfite exporter TauE/SafE family protein [Thermoleophilaceae bacterium]
MDPLEVAGLIAIGLAAGVASGLLGIGGGVLFVPGLVIFLDEPQLRAVSTSLVAVVIVAVVGAWRQGSYGNVRLRDGLIVGALSPLGVLLGAVLANTVSERALELSFAAVQLYFAWTLLGRAGLPLRRATR